MMRQFHHDHSNLIKVLSLAARTELMSKWTGCARTQVHNEYDNETLVTSNQGH